MIFHGFGPGRPGRLQGSPGPGAGPGGIVITARANSAGPHSFRAQSPAPTAHRQSPPRSRMVPGMGGDPPPGGSRVRTSRSMVSHAAIPSGQVQPGRGSSPAAQGPPRLFQMDGRSGGPAGGPAAAGPPGATASGPPASCRGHGRRVPVRQEPPSPPPFPPGRSDRPRPPAGGPAVSVSGKAGGSASRNTGTTCQRRRLREKDSSLLELSST